MGHTLTKPAVTAIVLVLISVCYSTESSAVEFKVDSRVLLNGRPQPVAEHTTWLTEEKIYNQTISPTAETGQGTNDQADGEVTIFDFEERAVTLLAPVGKK